MSAVRRENKESGSSPVDGVLQALLEVRRGQDGAPGWKASGEKERRERTSGKMLLLFKLKGAWLKSHKVAFLLQVKLDVVSGGTHRQVTD